MVDLQGGSIILNGKIEKIEKLEVWFATPLGLVANRLDAVMQVTGNDLPLTTIRPVPVAVGATTYEVL